MFRIRALHRTTEPPMKRDRIIRAITRVHIGAIRQPRAGVLQILRSIRALGVSSLSCRLAGLAFFSFIAGLSQAAFLIIASEIAIGSAQGKHNLHIRGIALSVGDTVLISVALLIVFLVTSMLGVFSSSSLSAATVEASRRQVIGSYFAASWEQQSTERLGHVQQLLSVNCENLGWLTLAISGGLQAILSASALLIAAFIVNPTTAVLVIGAGIVLSLVMRPFLSWSRKASFRLSRDSQRMATQVTEFTRLVREIRLLGVEQSATDILRDRNHQATLSYKRNRRLAQVGPVVYQTLAFGFIIGGLALLTANSGSHLGATGAILLLALRSLTYGSQIQTNSQQLRSFQGFLDGIEADILQYKNSSSASTSRTLIPTAFDITFDDVSFAYDGRDWAINRVTFQVPAGHILGVVGRSGSGKTTLSQLLLGMRTPTQGQVFIGGNPASALAIGNGTSPLAIVAQEPILLQGSIESNIAFFRDFTHDQIESASRSAHLHEDVAGMPYGYETSVGEGGGALSGGQRQRLSIARALVGSPRILVLDEPTSALDVRSEALVRQTLSELKGRVTVIVISHRLATVKDCDLLLVLESGVLADFGPPNEVTERGPFRRVAEAAVAGTREPGEPFQPAPDRPVSSSG